MSRPFFPYRNASEFLSERSDFLDVYVVKDNGGWDIVLRIDGTYFDESTARACAEGLRDGIRSIPDVAWKPYGVWGRWRSKKR